MTTMSTGRLDLANVELISRDDAVSSGALAAAFAEVGFTGPTVAAGLGSRDMWRVLSQSARYSLLAAGRQRDSWSPVDALTELFVLNGWLPGNVVAEALPEHLWRELFRLGLAVSQGDRTFGRLSISPVDGLLLFTDQLFHNGGDQGGIRFHGACVMPPHASTRQLAARPEPAARVIDAGCGSGVLALLAAAAGSWACGFDLDPRATAFARLNAALNGIDVEFRTADLSSFVAPRRADVLLFNSPTGPPVDPDLAQHGSLTPDAAIRQTVAAGQRLLVRGGRTRLFVLLQLPPGVHDLAAFVSTIVPDAVDVTDVVAAADSGFDVSATDLASAGEGRRYLLASSERARAALYDYLRAHDVERIVACVLTLVVR